LRGVLCGALDFRMDEATPVVGSKRKGFWYLKFLFAAYAAGLASWMLLMVVSLPFGGFEFGERWLHPYAGVQMLVLGLAWSPIIWRKLR
jgi:hypothetical protein